MLELLDGPDHIGAYRLSGTLTAEDFGVLVTDLEARLSRHRKLGLVVDVTSLDDITLRALLKDLRYGLRKVFEWHRFPREAVITDRDWLRKLVKLAGLLVPFVRVRTFLPDELTAAFAWVAEGVPSAG